MLPQVRHMASIQPADTVYSGPQSAPPRRVTLRTIRQMYAKNEPLSMVTAYDYPSAVHVSRAPCNLLSGSHSDLTWNLSGRDERYNVSASCLIPKKVQRCHVPASGFHYLTAVSLQCCHTP